MKMLLRMVERVSDCNYFCLVYLLDAILLIVTAVEQENDEHKSLVSDEKPTLEPFEGKKKLLKFSMFSNYSSMLV